jgi:integrase
MDTDPPRPTRSRRPRKIQARTYRNKERPHLRYVVNYYEAGERRRRYFEKEAEAAQFAADKNEERKQFGIAGADFPLWLRVMSLEAVEALKPFGRTIRDAVAHYVAHLKATERSCSARQLKAEMIVAAEIDSTGERHLSDMRTRLGAFAERFGEKPVASISPREIEDWLDSLPFAPLTKNHYRAHARAAFNFAKRKGYAVENPVEQVPKARERNHKPPGILTVAQASALLTAAGSEILPYFVIALFGGLRSAELKRLDWREVDFESGLIEVTAAKSKTATRRFVTMQLNLREWLLPHRQRAGSVAPEQMREVFDATRRAAGIDPWPANALRHSFASYHLAHFRNAGSTALELGHHDSRVTFAHYRELVKPKEAARFWNLRPASDANVVAIEA